MSEAEMFVNDEIEQNHQTRSSSSSRLWNDQLHFTGQLIDLFERYRQLVHKCIVQCSCNDNYNVLYNELEREYKFLLMDKVDTGQPSQSKVLLSTDNIIVPKSNTSTLVTANNSDFLKNVNTNTEFALVSNSGSLKINNKEHSFAKLKKYRQIELNAEDLEIENESNSDCLQLPKMDSVMRYDNSIYLKQIPIEKLTTIQNIADESQDSSVVSNDFNARDLNASHLNSFNVTLPQPILHYTRAQSVDSQLDVLPSLSSLRPNQTLVINQQPQVNTFILSNGQITTSTVPYSQIHLIDQENSTFQIAQTISNPPIVGNTVIEPVELPTFSSKKEKLLSRKPNILRKEKKNKEFDELSPTSPNNDNYYWKCDMFNINDDSGTETDKAQSAIECLRCDVANCDFATTSKSILKCHLKEVHQMSRPYKCTHEGCTASFKERYKLKVHAVVHTGEKPYICNWPGCKLRFSQSGHMSRHRKSHLFDNKFICTWPGCTRSFIQKHNLKNHLMRHRGEKPWSCEHKNCGKSFLEKWKLAKHQKIHLRNSASGNSLTDTSVTS